PRWDGGRSGPALSPQKGGLAGRRGWGGARRFHWLLTSNRAASSSSRRTRATRAGEVLSGALSRTVFGLARKLGSGLSKPYDSPRSGSNKTGIVKHLQNGCGLSGTRPTG